MSYNVFPTKRFEKEIKRLAKKFPSVKEEYAGLLTLINQNPATGTFLGNNTYKIRLGISSKGKGKSGGARVITYLYTTTEKIYLLTIYDKSEKVDLTANELKEMINSLELEV